MQMSRLAETLNVRMVVVGSHGKGALRRALLGSVSTYLTQHCTRPVLVVREHSKGAVARVECDSCSLVGDARGETKLLGHGGMLRGRGAY
jgi:hypothetical protein